MPRLFSIYWIESNEIIYNNTRDISLTNKGLFKHFRSNMPIKQNWQLIMEIILPSIWKSKMSFFHISNTTGKSKMLDSSLKRLFKAADSGKKSTRCIRNTGWVMSYFYLV